MSLLSEKWESGVLILFTLQAGAFPWLTYTTTHHFPLELKYLLKFKGGKQGNNCNINHSLTGS